MNHLLNQPGTACNEGNVYLYRASLNPEYGVLLDVQKRRLSDFETTWTRRFSIGPDGSERFAARPADIRVHDITESGHALTLTVANAETREFIEAVLDLAAKPK